MTHDFTYTYEPNPHVDVPRLRKVVDLAKAEAERAATSSHRSTWAQDTWARVNLNDVDLRAALTKAPTTTVDGVDFLALPVSCSTTGCIAGHAVMQAGGVLMLAGYELGSVRSWINAPSADEYPVDWAELDGKVDKIEFHAQRALGLTDEQREHLFDGENDIELVVAIAEKIAESAGDRL